MKKQPLKAYQIADDLLCALIETDREIKRLSAAKEEAIAALKESYEAKVMPLLKQDEELAKDLLRFMRQEKKQFFSAADTVNLPHGSLIHAIAQKIAFPRNDDALNMCEELGFHEVIKIAKSLDRDAVKQWPDERLILIGLERKSKEEFSYDLKDAQ